MSRYSGTGIWLFRWSFLLIQSNRHEFIHIFRYLECKTLHPADVHIIELIDDRHKTYEEESDTVFLAKDVMERISKLTSRAPLAHPQQFSRMRRR
jgi:hypothetical protein